MKISGSQRAKVKKRNKYRMVMLNEILLLILPPLLISCNYITNNESDNSDASSPPASYESIFQSSLSENVIYIDEGGMLVPVYMELTPKIEHLKVSKYSDFIESECLKYFGVISEYSLFLDTEIWREYDAEEEGFTELRFDNQFLAPPIIYEYSSGTAVMQLFDPIRKSNNADLFVFTGVYVTPNSRPDYGKRIVLYGCPQGFSSPILVFAPAPEHEDAGEWIYRGKNPSSDGLRVYFGFGRYLGNSDIYVYDLNSRSVARLTDTPDVDESMPFEVSPGTIGYITSEDLVIAYPESATIPIYRASLPTRYNMPEPVTSETVIIDYPFDFITVGPDYVFLLEYEHRSLEQLRSQSFQQRPYKAVYRYKFGSTEIEKIEVQPAGAYIFQIIFSRESNEIILLTRESSDLKYEQFKWPARSPLCYINRAVDYRSDQLSMDLTGQEFPCCHRAERMDLFDILITGGGKGFFGPFHLLDLDDPAASTQNIDWYSELLEP